ncbi:TIGR04552 family protein [Archangium sp. Cb G35]|uniref:TIGR04552 family protein n=1 Tax=Archangium sp. Cb G35 TaxID=1920190 RepID=UPI0009FA8DA4
MGLRELERIRLILRGGSVIDWRRMHFQSRDEVDRFLRLCQIDTSRPEDEAWARTVLADAVEYLRQTFDYRVADAVADPEEIHDLFLYASGVKGLPRHRRIACIVLKVMHVLQHIEGRDLMHRLAVSEADLSELVTSKVLGVAQLLRDKGLPVAEFGHSIKSRESLITKLLAKKETVAAQIYDRTRFRIITQKPADIVPVLYFLTQHLFPFNFVVPGQTENTLVSFKSVLEENPHLQQFAQHLHLDLDYEDREERTRNLFSGNTYRALNFVVDVPVRMDAYLPPPAEDTRERKNRTVFTLVEFQIMDEETARQNEEGENAHKLYKRRQKRRVLRRLSRGLVVPKRQS